jgi:penicillin-insensitive murein endopeptidase
MIAARIAVGPAAIRFGRSIGSPTEGHLVGGVHLDETTYLRVMPADTAGDVRWGLQPLVTMLDRAARTVRRQFPEAVTSVGHLSREGGGEVEQHRSHESGRDADVGFFVRGANGRPILPTHFVPFRADGSAAAWPGAYFDDAKNWALVGALVGDPQAHVTHVFVAAPLRARLLAYAERMGAPSSLRMRAAEVMQQPHGALAHDDHFHVRIACPAHMTSCVENPPMRSRSSAPMLARGRRGGPTHGLAGSARANSRFPGFPGTNLGATQASAPVPLPPLPGSPGSPRAQEPGDTDPPPALMSAPIDDVDG